MSTAVRSLAENVFVRFRRDLAVATESVGGVLRYLVKDPLSMKYFRFREHEWAILNQLDGSRTLEQARAAYCERPGAKAVGVRDVEILVRQALQAGLALVETRELGTRLFERRLRNRWKKAWRFPQTLLSLRVPLFDPDALLTHTLPAFRWAFSAWGATLALGVVASALLLVFMNWEAFLTKLPDASQFFTWWNLGSLWLALAFAKIVHEFGHGYACKHLGGEVRDMGLLLLIFSPCVYCNVSDAARFPDKWRRVLVGVAGVYFELTAAAVAVWLWWFSYPGLLHSLCMDIALVSSVHTLLFNANPLVRFDGYYVLADVLNVPNLGQRANRRFGNLTARVAFGAEVVPDPYRVDADARWQTAGLVGYSALSFAYRVAIAVGFVIFLSAILRPLGLASLALWLGALSLVGMIGMPTWNAWRTLRNRWQGMHVHKPRAALGVVGLTLLLAGVLFCPLPTRLDYPLLLRLQAPINVLADESGQLVELIIHDGKPASPGAELARMANWEVDRDYQTVAADLAKERQRAAVAERLGDAIMGAEARERVRQLSADLQHVEDRRARLSIRASAEGKGVAVGVPLPEAVGGTLQAGDLFCQIGDPTRLEAYIVVKHEDVSLLELGRAVWIKVPGHQGPIVSTAIARLGGMDLTTVPIELTPAAGGPVPVAAELEDDAARRASAAAPTQEPRPLEKSFAVLAPVDNAAGRLRPGMRGVARIDIGARSLAWRLDRWVRQTFHFKL